MLRRSIVDGPNTEATTVDNALLIHHKRMNNPYRTERGSIRTRNKTGAIDSKRLTVRRGMTRLTFRKKKQYGTVSAGTCSAAATSNRVNKAALHVVTLRIDTQTKMIIDMHTGKISY